MRAGLAVAGLLSSLLLPAPLASPATDEAPAGGPAAALPLGAQDARPEAGGDSGDPPAGEGGDAVEDLQQLIAQAAELSGEASTAPKQTVESLCRALESLLAALQAQSVSLEEGDLARAEEAQSDVDAGREGLQQAFEEEPADEAPPAGTDADVERPADDEQLDDDQQPAGDTLSRIRSYVGLALDVVQRIQDMRMAQREAREEASRAHEGEAVAEGEDPEEEPLGEVTGVVEDENGPVEGAVVSDSESGESAVTDDSGTYTLPALPSGRSELLVRKGPLHLASGRVDVSAGRTRVADFRLRPGLRPGNSPGSAGLRVLASRVAANPRLAAGRAGVIEGVVMDPAGRPVPRALVRLEGLASVRTDSRGRYAFTRVPAGTRRLHVSSAGRRPASKQVDVQPTRTARAGFTLGRVPRSGVGPERSVLAGRAAPREVARLRGTVTDAQGRPLPGAKVSVRDAHRSAAVRTRRDGRYELRGLRPGSYRLRVSRSGHAVRTLAVSLRPGATETLDVRLQPGPSGLPRRVPSRALTGRAEGRGSVGPPGGRPAGGSEPGPKGRPGGRREPPRSARLEGRVLDQSTGRPLSGARVAVRSRSDTTDSHGRYVLRDVPPGRCTLVVTRAGYATVRRSVSLGPGEAETLDVGVRRERQSTTHRR